ncbi:MAG: hypothetical protein AAB969_00410 [Patescibacteria group bacterium]
MSWKVFAALLFLALTALLIAISYHNSLKAKMDLANVSQANNQADLWEMTPQETYRLTIHNALPEIKALSFLVLIVFVIAIFGARFEVVSDITRDILERSFASMMASRPQKLAALAEQKRLKESLTIPSRAGVENVIAELERSIREQQSRNP